MEIYHILINVIKNVKMSLKMHEMHDMKQICEKKKESFILHETANK